MKSGSYLLYFNELVVLEAFTLWFGSADVNFPQNTPLSLGGMSGTGLAIKKQPTEVGGLKLKIIYGRVTFSTRNWD